MLQKILEECPYCLKMRSEELGQPKGRKFNRYQRQECNGFHEKDLKVRLSTPGPQYMIFLEAYRPILEKIQKWCRSETFNEDLLNSDIANYALVHFLKWANVTLAVLALYGP